MSFWEVNLIIDMPFGDKNTVDVRKSEESVFGSFSLVKHKDALSAHARFYRYNTK